MSLQWAGATACLRERPADPLRVIPAAEFVDTGRRSIGIEEHMAFRYPCYEAVDVDTRYARICPGAGAQVNQHQPLLLFSARSPRTLKRLETPHHVESGKSSTAEGILRTDFIVRRGSLGDAPNRECRAKPILLDATHADSQAQIHQGGGSADPDGSVASTSEAPKRQQYNRPRRVPFDEGSNKICHISGGNIWAPRGKRQQLHRRASSYRRGGGGVEDRRTGRER